MSARGRCVDAASSHERSLLKDGTEAVNMFVTGSPLPEFRTPRRTVQTCLTRREHRSTRRSPWQRCFKKAHENRVWRGWYGAQLRLVQRAHKEPMVGAFDGAHLAGVIGRGDTHAMLLGQMLPPGRKPVVARRAFHAAACAVERLQP